MLYATNQTKETSSFCVVLLLPLKYRGRRWLSARHSSQLDIAEQHDVIARRLYVRQRDATLISAGKEHDGVETRESGEYVVGWVESMIDTVDVGPRQEPQR